jgi:signal transduction histidine kinase
MNSRTDTDTAINLSHTVYAGGAKPSELERFAEIGVLSAMLLHEISSPLSAALLWLEQCKGQSPYIRHVRSSMRLLQNYVEAARQQVRRESRRRKFLVRNEIEQVRSILESVAVRRGVSLRFSPADCQTLYGDPIKFQHILANLVRNAIDSYDTCPDAGHKPVDIRFRTSDGYLVLEVRDRGCGIARNQLSKLFQPFYSTKASKGRGLGIGLFSVKRSVEEDFRGDVRVASRPGHGTRFTVRFNMGRM